MKEGKKIGSFCLPCLQSSYVTSIPGMHCASSPCSADTAAYKTASVVTHESQAGCRVPVGYLHLL